MVLTTKKAKAVFLIPLTFLMAINAFGQTKQKSQTHLDIDTLEIRNDSVLTKISNYENGDIISETTAFLFPDSHQISRFRLLRHLDLKGKFFTKTAYWRRVLRHGQSVEYLSYGVRLVTNYSYGNLIGTTYLDSSNKEIPRPTWYAGPTRYGPCGIVTGEYIIEGTKKRKGSK